MSAPLRSVIGAFRILRRRAADVSQPGLAIWADAGERAAEGVRSAVRDTAHRAELRSISLADEVQGMVADGIIDAGELKALRLAPDQLRKVASDCHDIGEAVL